MLSLGLLWQSGMPLNRWPGPFGFASDNIFRGTGLLCIFRLQISNEVEQEYQKKKY